MKLATAYLAKYPSESFTLRNLGSRLEKFLREEPHWTAPNEELAIDMVRFEWAQVVAFDDAALPKITTDDLLDMPADKLRLGLQPYISLLELNHGVDKFFTAVKNAKATSSAAKRATRPTPCRRLRNANAARAFRSANAFTFSFIATTTCSITNGWSPRPSAFCEVSATA